MRGVELAFEDARAGAVIAVLAGVALFGCGGRSERSEQSSNGGTAAGGSAGKAGASANGGSMEMTSGAGSPGDDSSCTSDADCTQCLYTAVPASTAECASSLGCCGGQVMNETTCAVNQAAFQRICAGQNVSPPICPCVLPDSNYISCKNRECGFWGP